MMSSQLQHSTDNINSSAATSNNAVSYPNIEEVLNPHQNVSNTTLLDESRDKYKNEETLENESIHKECGLLSSKNNTAATNSIKSSDAVLSQSQQSETTNERLQDKVIGYLNPWGIWSNRSNNVVLESNTESDINIPKEPIIQEETPKTPPLPPSSPLIQQTLTQPNSKFISDTILNQSPTVGVIEETITTVDTENMHTDNVENPNVLENNSNFIWNITRRVSLIPSSFLPPSTSDGQLLINELSPNKISPVIDNHQLISTSNSIVPLSSGTEQINNTDESHPKESLWWSPWNWRFSNKNDEEIDESVSDLGGKIIEDELLKVQRREIANQIKCQSYGIPKSVVWSIFNSSEEKNFGYVRITGNTYKKPVIMKNMPASVFELNERQLVNNINKSNGNGNGNISIAAESIVLPDIKSNYRDFTLRTKCRIALSKVPVLQSIFSPQSHLYYENNSNNLQTNKKFEKKAIVICFHGFLPQKISKNIIGENTSTSEQMKEYAVKELERWSDIQNIDVKIDTICIEGYGKLFERVNECLSILESWIEIISKCDYILTISNSHNVALTIHVMAKLITSGYFDNAEKLGFIGFSGLLMGPIPEVESKISTRGSVGKDNDIISELFDFQDPESLQSKELVRNMKILIKKNFKVTLIGSLNDCFTPLYSSLALHLIHPNIYRAIYIDGSQHQPDFITSLFNLILTVKNLNYSDHGLLLELSSFFTGSIGEGQHSGLLKNKYGYRIGINNMLNTSDLFYQKKLREEITNIREYTTNSYHIPWCLRGFLEELEKLQKHFDIKQMIYQLYEEFRSWEPETQKMKDLKYCMLAFESVLNEDIGL
ncbi:hypothetical protein C6P40_001955 [Pichia californica]|uniref:YMC020W-like alpha/beta hydrolase domain-containing protein n=1 Tax=Pichia californica TaxID=460514 RepID=A0A9P7BD65_9ASCO|nr:hypothetical protein C6P40_001955 [[Candida] californica]